MTLGLLLVHVFLHIILLVLNEHGMVAHHIWTSTTNAEEIASQAAELRIRHEKYGGMKQTRVVRDDGTTTVVKEKQPIWEMDKCTCDGGSKFLELGGTFVSVNIYIILSSN